MASPPSESAGGDTVLFRPSKKRKIYRQRAADDPEETRPAASTASPPPQSLDELIASSAGSALHIQDAELEGTPVSMAEILRLRKMKQRKVGGVEFSARSTGLLRDKDGELVRTEDGRDDSGGLGEGGVVRKFAPQTGTAGDVNKHM